MYNREKDKVNHENTRLSLVNQHMVVQAIANLATVISRFDHPGALAYFPTHHPLEPEHQDRETMGTAKDPAFQEEYQ